LTWRLAIWECRETTGVPQIGDDCAMSDIAAMKQQARATWAAGDFDAVAELIWEAGGVAAEAAWERAAQSVGSKGLKPSPILDDARVSGGSRGSLRPAVAERVQVCG
jgi:hypothetical protein